MLPASTCRHAMKYTAPHETALRCRLAGPNLFDCPWIRTSPCKTFRAGLGTLCRMHLKPQRKPSKHFETVLSKIKKASKEKVIFQRIVLSLGECLQCGCQVAKFRAHYEFTVGSVCMFFCCTVRPRGVWTSAG